MMKKIEKKDFWLMVLVVIATVSTGIIWSNFKNRDTIEIPLSYRNELIKTMKFIPSIQDNYAPGITMKIVKIRAYEKPFLVMYDSNKDKLQIGVFHSEWKEGSVATDNYEEYRLYTLIPSSESTSARDTYVLDKIL